LPSPRNRPSTLFFGSRHDGLQRSDDAGRTWRKVPGFPHAGLGLPADWREAHGGISFVLFDSGFPAIYAAVADPADRHLYRSTDGGESWTAVPGGPEPEMLPVKGDIDDAGNLYVAYATGIGPNDIADGAVWRLDTRSGQWSDITPDPASEGGYGGHTWQALRTPKLALDDEPARRYDLGGEAPINVSADGTVFIVGTPMALVTRDRGKTWAAPEGLPAGVRAIADKADPQMFYGVDFVEHKVFVSRDGARTFAPAAAEGLPAAFVRAGRTDREAQSPLVATPGSAGEIWLLLGHRLYRSRDAGGTFQLASADGVGIELFGLGKAAPGRDHPAVYAVGKKADRPGVWRSDDGGASWLRVNDDGHQWGLRFRAISGDPRRYGRVYIATDGRGLLYGDPATGNPE
jgi:photosystem II stability/assembly factor-like uncharacterized protein